MSVRIKMGNKNMYRWFRQWIATSQGSSYFIIVARPLRIPMLTAAPSIHRAASFSFRGMCHSLAASISRYFSPASALETFFSLKVWKYIFEPKIISENFTKSIYTIVTFLRTKIIMCRPRPTYLIIIRLYHNLYNNVYIVLYIEI